MHSDGFIILLIPLMSFSAICRGGKWHWNVMQQIAGDDIRGARPGMRSFGLGGSPA
jgi:hypothetical protein